jgi:hypothetical protein
LLPAMVASNHSFMTVEGTVYLLHFERLCNGSMQQAQDSADIPFDIRHIRVLVYAPSTQGMADLEPRLRTAILYEMSRPTSLTDVLHNSGLRST